MENDIKHFYFTFAENFGDGVNSVFFDKLTNNKNKHDYVLNVPHYFCTGSIMRFVNEYSIVFGTGFISQDDDIGSADWEIKSHNKVYTKPYKVLSVRGPKTRQKLLDMDIDCPEIYGDPLMLFPLIYNNPNIMEIKNKVGVIPHYIDKNQQSLKNIICILNNDSIENIMIDINTGTNYEPFIDDILSCEYIIASSLHAIIMGIVYKKKTIFVKLSDNVVGDSFKFYDFFESINVFYHPITTFDETILNKTINYDINTIKNVVNSIINACPFIPNKQELYDKCNDYYKL